MALVDLDPRIVQRLTEDTPARRWVLDTLETAAADPLHASSRLRTAARDARKLRSRERRALFDVVYDLIREDVVLTALGAESWAARLDLWLTDPDRSAQPFHVRAGCSEAQAADLLATYGEAREDWLSASNDRAPSHLRVNLARTSLPNLVTELAGRGIQTEPLGGTALRVVGRANLIGDPAFQRGAFELQDAGSQAVVDYVQAGSLRVLDLCAGAGGKSLALAASGAKVSATDIRRRALGELRKRAERARTPVEIVDRQVQGVFDRVLVDAPCSGSGVWRRHPEYRWRLREEGVPTTIQASLLAEAAEHTTPEGEVVYATCSALQQENEAVVQAFLEAHPAWEAARPALRLAPHTDGTDGMFAAALRRSG